MQYNASEGSIPDFPGFPAYPSTDVCATGAMVLDAALGVPTIKQAACVLCGACATRCPIGAIRLEPAGAVVQSQYSSAFEEATLADHMASRQELAALPRAGIWLRESDAILEDLQYRLLAAQATSDVANLIVRNVLRTLGHRAEVRRKGSNSIRMDVMVQGVQSAPCEVEFSDGAFLDTPRDILDDVAVLAARHGWQPRRRVAIAIPLVFPNRRSEYWSLVEDIVKVAGLRIHTASVLLLILSVWNRTHLDVTTTDYLMVDRSLESYKSEVVERTLGRGLSTSRSSALLESVK